MRIIFFLLGAIPVLSAQTAPAKPDKGVIAGKVFNSSTGEPVRKAQVKLMGMTVTAQSKPGSSGGGSVVTDAAGRFEFTALASGSYALFAAHDGYDSATALGGMKLLRVTLAGDEEKNDVVIRLTPYAVVTGRILDDEGDPIRQIRVEAMINRYTASGRRLVSRGQAITNDLGEYRIYDLPAGRYYLKAGSPESLGGHSAGESYGALYYPGTTDASAAATLDAGAGQTLEGMNLTLHLTRFANIRGRVMNPGNGMVVGLMKVTEDGGTSSTNSGIDNASGRFELKGVSPGAYFLTARSTVGGQEYSAHLPIQVGAADLEGVELHLLPPVDIAGQIRIEGKTDAKMPQIRVTLETEARTAMSTMADGGSKGDGAFEVRSLEPGIYHVSVMGPEDLYLKAARWSDRDITQSGLDLTQGAAESRLMVLMSANGGQIEGVVVDDQSAPAAVALVTLVPSGVPPSKSLFKTAMTSPAGHFLMRGIAPGSYKLFAWDNADPNEILFNPDFTRQFESQSKTVEVTEGSKDSVQLTLIRQAAETLPAP